MALTNDEKAKRMDLQGTMELVQDVARRYKSEISDKKADEDGTYPDMTVGKSQNIFGSTQTNDVFVYRPTAGIQDIQSGEPGLGGAEVQKIEGNGMAWNQLVRNGDFSSSDSYWDKMSEGFTGTVSDGEYTGTVTIAGSKIRIAQAFANNIPANHKVYARFDIYPSYSITSSGQFILRSAAYEAAASFAADSVPNNTWSTFKNILAPTLEVANFDLFSFGNTEEGVEIGDSCKYRNIAIIDLTLLFGVGNEPSTVAEFEAWLSNNIGLKGYYPYCAGELIGVKSISIKTTGFNQWDEEWEVGGINGTTGQNETAANIFRSKNYIPVVGGMTYLITKDYTVCCIYDADKNFIGQMPWRYASFEGAYLWDVPREARYARFSSTSIYGPTYNHDICINLSHSGDRDGEYEPYWSETKELEVGRIYGKLNGEGNPVKVWSDGVMKSAGNGRVAEGVIQDIIDFSNDVIEVNVDSRNLGNIDYFKINGTYPYYQTGISNLPIKRTDSATLCRIRCVKFNGGTMNSLDTQSGEGTIVAYINQDYVYLQPGYDYGTAAEFKSAMSGVECWFERMDNNKLTYTNLMYDTSVLGDGSQLIPLQDFVYSVDDWGTEELLLGNTSSIVSCSPKMSIKYGINAADAIKNLPHNYVSVKQQTLSSTEKAQARQNIGACAENDSRLSDARVASNMIADYTEVSSNTSGVTTSLTQDGSETKVFYNSGNAAVTVSFASSGLIFVDGNDSMEIPAGGYGEVNFLRVTTDNTTRVFVRSIVSGS